MIQYDDIFDVDSILSFVVLPQSDPARRQVQLCRNLIAKLFEKTSSPCKQEFPEVKSEDSSLITVYQASVKSCHCVVFLLLKYYHHIESQLQIKTDDIELHFSSFFHRMHQKHSTSEFKMSKLNIHRRCFRSHLDLCIYTRVK